MSKIQSTFLKGLFTLLPIVVTIYIIYSVIRWVENLIRIILPEAAYIPGIGLLTTFFLIFGFGLLLNKTIVSSILSNFEEYLTEIPFIKAIYSPLRDLMNLFAQSKQKDSKSVVLVDLYGQGIKSIGIVTRDSFHDLPSINNIFPPDKVSVFLPFSYGLGGITVLVPKEKIEHVAITPEKAMSLAITGWVKAEEKGIENEQ